jgi:hypothetical protein
VQQVTVAASREFQEEEIVYSIGPSAESEFVSDGNTGATERGFQIGDVGGAGAVWQMTLSTNGKSIVYKLDTGAQANILPYAEYQHLVSRPRLHEVKTRLFSYGADSPIPVKGQCICDVGMPGGGIRKLRFYFLAPTVRAVPLLGLTACDRMNLIKRIEAAVEDQSDLKEIRRDPIAKEFQDLFGAWEGWRTLHMLFR